MGIKSSVLGDKRVKRQKVSEFMPILTIKNFVGIGEKKELTVEFKRFVIFIGEQTSGKSVTCKLYYFFTQALQEVAYWCLTKESNVDVFRHDLIQKFQDIFPETAWREDSFWVAWRFGELKIKVSHKKGNKRISLDLNEYANRYVTVYERYVELKKEWQRLDDQKRRRTKSQKIEGVDAKSDKLQSDLTSTLFSAFRSKLFNEKFPQLSVDYVPAGRAFLSQIRDNLFSLAINGSLSFDPFLREFGSVMERVRTSVTALPEFKDLCEKILHGTYEFDGTNQWIITGKMHKIRLSDASSGQQEALPLLMMLAQFAAYRESPAYRDSFAYRNPKSVTMKRIMIEEPEAHLYPTAQQKIVDFIGNLLIKDNSVGCVITTHSPFILSCVDNVLKRKKGLADCISAYHLHDGGGESIFDAELGMINAERFDSMSFQIANDEYPAQDEK